VLDASARVQRGQQARQPLKLADADLVGPRGADVGAVRRV